MVPLSCLVIFSEDLRAQLDSMKMAGCILNFDRFRNKSSAMFDSNPFPDLYLYLGSLRFASLRISLLRSSYEYIKFNWNADFR